MRPHVQKHGTPYAPPKLDTTCPNSKKQLISFHTLSISYTMGCPPVRGDNPRALASGLSYVQVDKHGITILCHPH